MNRTQPAKERTGNHPKDQIASVQLHDCYDPISKFGRNTVGSTNPWYLVASTPRLILAKVVVPYHPRRRFPWPHQTVNPLMIGENNETKARLKIIISLPLSHVYCYFNCNPRIGSPSMPPSHRSGHEALYTLSCEEVVRKMQLLSRFNEMMRSLPSRLHLNGASDCFQASDFLGEAHRGVSDLKLKTIQTTN